MHPVEQPGSAVRAMPCGLEPHQYDLHEHLFRGRHAGYIPLGRRMGALRLAGRRGCRSAALRRLAVAHAPQRKIAPHKAARYGPPPYSGRTPGFHHNRPQALPHTPAASRTAFAAASGYCPLWLQPPLAPVSARECRPRFPRTGKDPHASAKPTPSVLSHEFPVFTPMLRRPICLPPPGNAARPLRNRKPKPIPDPSPASPDAPGPCIPADSAGRPDPMSPPKARTTRKRPPKDTNSSIYQLIRLKFAGGGKLLSLYSRTPPKNSNHS